MSILLLTLFGRWGGAQFPRWLGALITFLILKQTPPNLTTYPINFLATIFEGRSPQPTPQRVPWAVLWLLARKNSNRCFGTSESHNRLWIHCNVHLRSTASEDHKRLLQSLFYGILEVKAIYKRSYSNSTKNCREQQHRLSFPAVDPKEYYRVNVAVPFLDHIISENWMTSSQA